LHAATDHELDVSVASPTGGGELWTASWRWWAHRPRVAAGIVAPSPFKGIWSLVGFTERQTYGDPTAAVSERRHGMTLTASDWMTGTTRLQAGASIDRWPEGATGSVEGALTQAFGHGRGMLSADANVMLGVHRTALIDASVEWRSTRERIGSTWHARAGFSAAGAAVPFALWPGAGTGQGRATLLRAHPLVHSGVIRGVFGRRLAHANVEWRYWRWTALRSMRIAPAAFVDTARALRVPAFGDDRAHVDAGLGIRVAMPGAGVLRVDVARGLRDGEMALSAGWTR
jgi:hypothetical protein